jgi:hypothetical protein
MRWLGLRVGGALAWVVSIFVEGIVDGLVDLVGVLVRELGHGVRALQSGSVRFYALVMMLGVVLLLLMAFFYEGR